MVAVVQYWIMGPGDTYALAVRVCAVHGVRAHVVREGGLRGNTVILTREGGELMSGYQSAKTHKWARNTPATHTQTNGDGYQLSPAVTQHVNTCIAHTRRAILQTAFK